MSYRCLCPISRTLLERPSLQAASPCLYTTLRTRRMPPWTLDRRSLFERKTMFRQWHYGIGWYSIRRSNNRSYLQNCSSIQDLGKRDTDVRSLNKARKRNRTTSSNMQGRWTAKRGKGLVFET